MKCEHCNKETMEYCKCGHSRIEHSAETDDHYSFCQIRTCDCMNFLKDNAHNAREKQ